MAKEAPDPWRKMGVKPTAPGRGLKSKLARLDPAFREEDTSRTVERGEGNRTGEEPGHKAKICRVCRNEFIPARDYYHTCPSCFNKT